MIVFIVGVFTGFVAGLIDIGADWMSDLREGVCAPQFWYNKESCCWDSEVQFGKGECEEWVTWSLLFKFEESGLPFYVMNYFFYTLSAFIFALATVVLVRFFAPYACGSGIPEVRILRKILMFLTLTRKISSVKVV